MNNSILYTITVVIWGSTWLAIEYQLGVVEPEVSIAYRYAAAALVLFAWCRFRGLSLRFSVKEHAYFVLLGLLLFCLNYIFAYRAQVHITSALAAIAFSTMLWMNIILSRIFFGTRVTVYVLAGALLGIVGIVVLFAPQIESIAVTDSMFFGSVLALGGALTASFGNMLSQSAQKRRLPVVETNTWGMFYGAILTSFVALASGHEFNFDATFTYISSLAYLAIFGSVIAFGAYLTLLGRIGAHKAGYVTVMFPVVAVILSVVFEGMRLTGTIVTGAALVLLGNLLILKKDA
ncbi:MAG: EamA family transporter [Gammaproteobacteria bacterium]|jgi:drug/metabolite transporter (DMT)-like permease|nr:EamA family transporter [Gammaproteobacteria bacterium]